MAGNRMEKLESYVLSVMDGRRKGAGPSTLRVVLLQFSLLFRTAVQIRLALFRHGIFRHQTLGCQVLSVGNLTVGGTGKTPVVEVFARSLSAQGRKVAILSRGYKRVKPSLLRRLINVVTFEKVSDPVLVVSDGKELHGDSAMSGDEPFMLARNLPGVCVVVSKNRVKAGQHAIRRLGCDTLILDDGFQYLYLKHRLDIVLVDRTNPFGNRYLLPRGILREPVRNIKRAGFIFITKCPPGGDPDLKRQLRELNPHAEISECRHCPRYVQSLDNNEKHDLSWLEGRKIGAVSAIAVPKGFEDELVKLGASLVYHKRYADHHRYSMEEIEEVFEKCVQRGAQALLTTEKDAVRFPQRSDWPIPVYFLRVDIEMLSGKDAFDNWISRICFR